MRVRQNRVLANCVAHFHARRWSRTLIAVEPFRVHLLLWFHVFTESAITAFSIDLSTLYTRHFHTPHSTLHTLHFTLEIPHLTPHTFLDGLQHLCIFSPKVSTSVLLTYVGACGFLDCFFFSRGRRLTLICRRVRAKLSANLCFFLGSGDTSHTPGGGR